MSSAGGMLHLVVVLLLIFLRLQNVDAAPLGICDSSYEVLTSIVPFNSDSENSVNAPPFSNNLVSDPTSLEIETSSGDSPTVVSNNPNLYTKSATDYEKRYLVHHTDTSTNPNTQIYVEIKVSVIEGQSGTGSGGEVRACQVGAKTLSDNTAPSDDTSATTQYDSGSAVNSNYVLSDQISATNSGTPLPTFAPTFAPTSVPSSSVPSSSVPSSSPSNTPSGVPTWIPSNMPTTVPSNTPTNVPSAVPSNVPTTVPSNTPTNVPTTVPSNTPTNVPTTVPSNTPTNVPSNTPTNVPTTVPSNTPTNVPTTVPSNTPTNVPSAVPSNVPTTVPTGQPTGQPTSRPSMQPSSQPSSRPSGQPTTQPSGQPSSQPSSQPSGQPSMQPSGQPTGQPTQNPTHAPSFRAEEYAYVFQRRRVRNKQACENLCSGHGACNPNTNICDCYKNMLGEAAYTGHDCSMKTCPKGLAWTPGRGEFTGSNNAARPSVECSDRGICNRDTGECECFDGYQGIACQRVGCFASKIDGSECNDRGYCAPMKELAKRMNRTYDSPWDSLKIWGCVCDPGYRGPACEFRECPTKEDPLGGLGSESGRDCSGRGKCDYNDGECNCFSGYHGAACEAVTIIM